MLDDAANPCRVLVDGHSLFTHSAQGIGEIVLNRAPQRTIRFIYCERHYLSIVHPRPDLEERFRWYRGVLRPL